MEKTIKIEVPTNESRRMQAAVEECISEMQRANDRMQKDQLEIEHLKAKTRAMLTELETA